MQENQPVQPQPQPAPQPQVGFPAPRDNSGKKSGIMKWVIALIGIIIIVGVGMAFILKGGEEPSVEPTPTGGTLSAFDTPAPSAEATSTPTPKPIDKSEIKVEVLNGTGTPGDAGLVKSRLENLGYKNIEADNADDQEETETTITYSRDLDPAAIDEMVADLEKVFKTVKTRTGTVAGDFDIRILTGAKTSGGTSATASPKATATSSPTPTPIPTN